MAIPNWPLRGSMLVLCIRLKQNNQRRITAMLRRKLYALQYEAFSAVQCRSQSDTLALICRVDNSGVCGLEQARRLQVLQSCSRSRKSLKRSTWVLRRAQANGFLIVKICCWLSNLIDDRVTSVMKPLEASVHSKNTDPSSTSSSAAYKTSRTL